MLWFHHSLSRASCKEGRDVCSIGTRTSHERILTPNPPIDFLLATYTLEAQPRRVLHTERTRSREIEQHMLT